MALLLIITFLVVVASLIYFWIRKKFTYLEDNGFLFEKPVFPLGNLKGAGKEFHLAYRVSEYYNKFKGKAQAFGMYFSFNPVIFITDLEIVKHVMVRDFDAFRNRGLYHNKRDDPLACHLFTIEDAEWKNMRQKLTPTFTSGKMKTMFDTIVTVSDLMIEKLQENKNSEAVEVKEALAEFTTDVIGNVAFGLEMNSIANPDALFRKMGKKIFKQDSNIQQKVFLMTSFPKLALKLRMRFIPEDVSDFFLKTIKETVDYRHNNNIERNDVMDLLIKIKNKEGSEGITFEELAAQCFIFFAAGFETSSSTSTFVLYSLAINQDIQEKTRDEIKRVLKKHGGELTYEAMLEMKYLQMVIDETLRLYGPVFQLLRTASRDYKIENSNLTIKEGTLTVIPIYAIHTDPEIYPEPEKFDPERFSEENKRDRHPMAYLPFGDGPRNCIGLRFGLMQTKIGLIQLLTNFKFSPSDKTTIPMTFDAQALILSPPNGMWLKMEKL